MSQISSTNRVLQEFAAIVTDALQNLLDFLDEARMEDGFRQLDVAEMPCTFRHVLLAGHALELSVDASQLRVIETVLAGFRAGLVHRLGV